tara:strand:+ start:86 stop:409 length:324 start_codon:yes stop_codon:yes gene_type:complete
LQFRTNRNGQVYPSNKDTLRFNPETKTFNMFTNSNNESDNQKRKHLEEFAEKTKNNTSDNEEYNERPEWDWLKKSSNNDNDNENDNDNDNENDNDYKSHNEVFSQGL